MKGETLPDHDAVLRMCKTKQLHPETAKPTAAAFLPREGETFLSVNWIQYFGPIPLESAVDAIRTVLQQKMSVRNSYLLANIPVGAARKYVSAETGGQRSVSFRHEPMDEPVQDLSHAGIFEYDFDDLEIAELLADAIVAVYPAKIR